MIERHTVRNSLAGLFRKLPHFRGKSRIGTAVGRLLVNPQDHQNCISTVVMQNGDKMILDVRSRTEVWPYWTGQYDNHMIQRLANCLDKGDVVLDVGANIGFYTVALGRKIQTINGSLFSFEPVPGNFARLSKNVQLNELEKTVTLFPVALGAEDGNIEMSVEEPDGASTGNAVIVRAGSDVSEGHSTVNAAIRKLDDVASEHNIHACKLIKVDIEGHEVEFLRGGIDFITQHRPIIYGEFATYWMKTFGHSFQDVVDIMRPLNYQFFLENQDGKFQLVQNPEEDSMDVLLVPAEKVQAILSKIN